MTQAEKGEALIVGLRLILLDPEKKDKVFFRSCCLCGSNIFITSTQKEKFEKAEYNYFFNCMNCLEKKLRQNKDEYNVVDLNPDL
jgi:hypothetical protein